jgi:hypothetical protein
MSCTLFSLLSLRNVLYIFELNFALVFYQNNKKKTILINNLLKIEVHTAQCQKSN